MEYIFKIKILLISYLAGMLGGLTFIVISRIFYDDYQSYDSKCASDVIAIANTYIVYTTLILVIITIIATLAGIWFSKQFSLSKEK
uniref:Uncharacterized protein n=1 Tax=Candidatus Kentrum sp. UNK TaxID=2126344 RepID=A0A451B2N0_9GAMM|nr:MAG: hypothetical protein BECKUNK1418G_GA0071005_11286 [Candidatus Kentron sp. UNK]VFK72544.1 MAG: hypothetical protein BECKUNK1418H_GA0071006_11216 [Candidatus Kentron sp. UNK]